MLQGLSGTTLMAACESKLGLKPAQSAQFIAEARKKLTIAADFNRDEQVGVASARLNHLYAEALGAQELQIALQAQKELNKLLDLYSHPVDAEVGGPDPEVEAVYEHLAPLIDGGEALPLSELARRVAAKVMHGA